MRQILIDSGILLSYYPAEEPLHGAVVSWCDRTVASGGILTPALEPADYARIAELNSRYADLPGDFADLSLVLLSEQLGIAEILSLDSDFDVYRRFRRQPFQRVSLQE